MIGDMEWICQKCGIRHNIFNDKRNCRRCGWKRPPEEKTVEEKTVEVKE